MKGAASLLQRSWEEDLLSIFKWMMAAGRRDDNHLAPKLGCSIMEI